MPPGSDRETARNELQRLDSRLADVVDKAKRGADVGGLLAPLEYEASTAERDLIVGAGKRLEAAAGAERPRSSAVSSPPAARPSGCSRSSASPRSNRPPSRHPGRHRAGRGAHRSRGVEAYLRRLDAVSRALTAAQNAYANALAEREELVGLSGAYQAQARATGVDSPTSPTSPPRLDEVIATKPTDMRRARACSPPTRPTCGRSPARGNPMSTTTAAPACTQPGCAATSSTGTATSAACPAPRPPRRKLPQRRLGRLPAAGLPGTIVDGYCDVCGTPGEGGIQSGAAGGESGDGDRDTGATTAAACRRRSSRSSRQRSRTAHRAHSPAARGTSSTGTATPAAPPATPTPSAPAALPASRARRRRCRGPATGSPRSPSGRRAGVAGSTKTRRVRSESQRLASGPARRRSDDDPAGSAIDAGKALMKDPVVPEDKRFCSTPLRTPGRARQGRQPGPDDRVLREVPPGVLLRPEAQARRPGRWPVRGGRLPGPRRPRLDLPRPRPERLEPLGGPQGPAQLWRPGRAGRGHLRAAVPRRGRAPAHRRDLQLRDTHDESPATSSWSTSAASR